MKDKAAYLDNLIETAVLKYQNGDIESAFQDIIEGVPLADEFAAEWKNQGIEALTVRHPIEIAIAVNMVGPELYTVKIPNVAHAYYLAGSMLYETEHFDEALEMLMISLDYNPFSARTWLEIAETFKRVADWENVVNAAGNALECGWSIIEISHAHRALAFAYGEMGDYERSAAHLILSYDYTPEEPVIKSELLWLGQQGYDIAQMTLDKAIEICGEDSGIAVTPVVAAAGMTLLLQDGITSPLSQEMDAIISSWSREDRRSVVSGGLDDENEKS